MHNHSNWINYVLSGGMFAVTGVLAWATWKYMDATKKMADSMRQQSEIMQREFEFRTMPFTEEIVYIKQTGVLNPPVDITISNKGYYPVFCLNVDFRIFADGKENEIHEDHIDLLRWLGKGESCSQEITLNFNELSSFSSSVIPRNNATIVMIFHYQPIGGDQFQKEKRLYY